MVSQQENKKEARMWEEKEQVMEVLLVCNC
jgi:hypothetical protein